MHDVRVTDEDGTFLAGSLSVMVKNVAPTVVLSGPITANEGETMNYSFTVSDPGDDTFTLVSQCCGVNGNLSNASFDSISGAGGLDCSYPDGTALSDVTVQVKDSDDDERNIAMVTVAVENLAPTTPVDDNAAPNEISEDAVADTVVGVTAISSDLGVLDTVTFRLADDAEGQFQIDANTGVVTVADATKLNFEDATSHSITVEAWDGEDASFQDFTISVLNVDPATPTDSNGDANEVEENAPDGTAVGITASSSDPNGTAIDGVTVELLDSAFALLATDTTELGGVYAFTVDDEFATYRIRETQPTGVDEGAAILGSAGGSVINENEMDLTLSGGDASDYDFTETGQAIQAGDTATIGFWQNKNGQALIKQGGLGLATWLSINFGNVFGDTFTDGNGGDGDGVLDDAEKDLREMANEVYTDINEDGDI